MFSGDMHHEFDSSEDNGPGFFMGLCRFIVMACTDVAMLPALNVMRKNRRHFELFIGIFHLFISVCFNIAGALSMDLFLTELEWHFISDVLTVTYALLLCVHLMGIVDENTNIVLRYVAFAASWLSKVKDQWDSTWFEILLIISYVLLIVYFHATTYNTPRRIPINVENAQRFGLCLVALFFIWILSETIFIYDSFHFIYGIYHVVGGLAFYHAWLSVPCRDTKKNDDLLSGPSAYT